MIACPREARVLLALLIAVASASAQEATEGSITEGFSGYAAAPEFSVVPRKDELVFYPCSQCHEFLEPDPTVRELMAPHEIEFDHGAGRIWCLSCHMLEDRDQLKSALGEAVDFDAAHQVCGSCHGNRHKDWYFGAHGKRQSSWNEPRVIYNCTHCHDAHSPAIKPRKPMPAPKARAGLSLPEWHRHEKKPVWERDEKPQKPEDSDEEK